VASNTNEPLWLVGVRAAAQDVGSVTFLISRRTAGDQTDGRAR
jgi:hypothetical protein